MTIMLNRSVHTWRCCKPAAMVNQSAAALEYAFIDAQHDILALVDYVRKLEGQLAKKRSSIDDISDDDLVKAIRSRDLVDEFANDFPPSLGDFTDAELNEELGERGPFIKDMRENCDHRLEQIWLHYRGKDVPQCLADYLWDTIGKAV